ncbi:hypothetical protein [Bradyrhizobium sp.]|uniref:hypothetical protein n=1 Tax=Bradyrhizobium sp. TaxID=376 RepID=UPI003C28C45A
MSLETRHFSNCSFRRAPISRNLTVSTDEPNMIAAAAVQRSMHRIGPGAKINAKLAAAHYGLQKARSSILRRCRHFLLPDHASAAKPGRNDE